MKNNLLCNKKADLYKDGNFFNYFFLDITKEEWADMGADDYSLEYNLPINSEVIETLHINKIVKFNGIYFFVRFKDVYREKIAQEIRDKEGFIED